MDDRNILIPGLGSQSYNQSECKGCRWLRPCCLGLFVALLMMFTFATIMFSLYLLKDEIDDVRTRDMIIIKALMEKHNFHFDDDFEGSGDGVWNRHTSPPRPDGDWFTTMSDWYYRTTMTHSWDYYTSTAAPDSGNYYYTTSANRYDWNSEPSTTEAPYDWNSYTTEEPYDWA